MERIKFMLGRRWESKPPQEKGGIASCSHREECNTIQSLAKKIVDGYSFRPGILVGGLGNDFWKEQQLFALDFDNKENIKQIDEIYKLYVERGIVPAFIYTTSSHTIEVPKFRVVFCANEAIKDGNVRDKFQATLMGVTDCCDINCKDRNRFFYGCMTHEVLYANYEARINAKSIIDNYYQETEQFTKYLANSSKTSTKISNSTKKKEKKVKTEVSSFNVDAISNLDMDAMKEALVLSSCKYIDDIDLAEYLGVPSDESFCCILPEHMDTHPSANILANDGVQLYKCHGCNKCLNVIDITCELADCTKKEAIEFLMKVYNIEYAYELIEKYKKIYTDFVAYLDSDEFVDRYPIFNKVMGNRKEDLKRILRYMSNNISTKYQADNKPVFFLSTSNLLEICEQTRNDNVSKSITLFCFLEIFSKIEVTALDKRVRDTTYEITKKHKLKKYVNFIQVNDVTEQTLQQCEEFAKTFKKNKMTIKNLSREHILATFGIEKANKVFPQYKYDNQCGISDKSQAFIDETSIKIMNAICEARYIKEINLYSNDETKKLWNTFKQTILDSNNLKRVRLNKKLKQSLNIECSGYPYIIVRA